MTKSGGLYGFALLLLLPLSLFTQSSLVVNTGWVKSSLFKGKFNSLYAASLEVKSPMKGELLKSISVGFGYSTDILLPKSPYGKRLQRYFIFSEFKKETKWFSGRNNFKIYYSSSLYFHSYNEVPFSSVDAPFDEKNIGLMIGLSPEFIHDFNDHFFITASVPINIIPLDYNRSHLKDILIAESERKSSSMSFFSDYLISFKLGIGLVTKKKKRRRSSRENKRSSKR